MEINVPGLDVKDKVAIVTGSSKGIGYGMAYGLAAYGAKVVVLSRNIEESKEAAGMISQKTGAETYALKCDVTKKDEVDDLINNVLEKYGRIDILVNNAGRNIRKQLEEYTEEEWESVIETNLKGIFLAAQAVTKVMKKQEYGKIINISSIFGSVAMPLQGAYAPSKGGIEQLTRVMAQELAPYSVTVNAIAPAYIKTPMTAEFLEDEEKSKAIFDNTPLRRLGERGDLIGPVVLLASDASAYITGHVLSVDGGWLCR